MGSRQKVLIDGATALARNASFIIPYKNYKINSETNAIGIVICDYIHDGAINGMDYTYLRHYKIGTNQKEEYCFDINNDGAISNFETSYFNEFASTSFDWTNEIYTSWK